MTDQVVELVQREAFSQSKTDPRVAKTSKDCCFIVEKKEQRKATVEMFVARVFDVGRQIGGEHFSSFLGSGFAIENRPTEPQDGAPASRQPAAGQLPGSRQPTPRQPPDSSQAAARQPPTAAGLPPARP